MGWGCGEGVGYKISDPLVTPPRRLQPIWRWAKTRPFWIIVFQYQLEQQTRQPCALCWPPPPSPPCLVWRCHLETGEQKMTVLSSKGQCHENFDLFFVLTGIGAPWLSIYNIVEYHVSNLGISDTELETILKNSSPGPLFFLFSLFAKWKISIHCGKSIKFKIVLLIIVVLCWYTWYCVLSTLCLKSHFIIYLSVLD